jgi:hypothetical protein
VTIYSFLPVSGERVGASFSNDKTNVQTVEVEVLDGRGTSSDEQLVRSDMSYELYETDDRAGEEGTRCNFNIEVWKLEEDK